MHEASLYSDNLFITLTYDDQNLPADWSLDVTDWQQFMKRLKNATGRKKTPLRFFHCGEYGDQLGRPHYHALLFGIDLNDKKPYKKTETGEVLYTSELLERVWGKGFCPIGNVTFESAGYVARYTTKKISGAAADAHYDGRRPEYATMSRNPGIGRLWFDRFKTDCYPHDYAVVNGKRVRPPKFYDTLLDSEELEALKKNRTRTAKKYSDNNTPDRLAVRHEIQLRRQAEFSDRHRKLK